MASLTSTFTEQTTVYFYGDTLTTTKYCHKLLSMVDPGYVLLFYEKHHNQIKKIWSVGMSGRYSLFIFANTGKQHSKTYQSSCELL